MSVKGRWDASKFEYQKKEPVVLDYEPQEIAERMSRMKGGQFEEDEDRDASAKKVNLSEEFSYRQNMETKLSDSLATFKEAEQERLNREKAEKEESERKKQEKLEKEKLRLEREKERNLKIQQQIEEKERLRKLKEEEQKNQEETQDFRYDNDRYVNEHQLNLSDEFKYRQEMDTKVSDRLAAIKQAENENKLKEKAEKEESERKKQEKLEKERIRLEREKERNLKIQQQIEEKEKLRKLKEMENPDRQETDYSDPRYDDGRHVNDPLVDLKKEFQYRQEMDTRVSDRLAVFKQAESENKTKAQFEKEESERKRLEKQQKEEERIQRENDRRLKMQQEIERKKEEQRQQEENRKAAATLADGDPDHIKREREMAEEVERELLKKAYTKGKPSKDVLKRWTSSNNEKNPEDNVSHQRRSSDDSGIVNEDAIDCLVENSVECSPEGIDGIDFRRGNEYSGLVITKRRSSGKNTDNSEQRSYNREISTDSTSSLDRSDEQGKSLEEIKSGLLVRLEIAEKKANDAEQNKNYLKQIGEVDEAADAEEDFHTASLEITRIKKRLKQIENEIKNGSLQRKNKESVKLSRECKAPVNKQPPPVDVTSFNDDGECVPEGIISHRLKSFSRKMH